MVTNSIQNITVSVLAILLSGILDKCLNRTGDHLATASDILDQNVLNQEFIEILMNEVNTMRIAIEDRTRNVTYYQLYITEKSLAEDKEPRDRDLEEIETVNDAGPTARNDMQMPEKQVFAIVGPDLKNIDQGIRYVDI